MYDLRGSFSLVYNPNRWVFIILEKREEESLVAGAGLQFCVVRSLRTQILANRGSCLLFSTRQGGVNPHGQ